MARASVFQPSAAQPAAATGAPRFIHTCGADVVTRVVCAECGQPLEGGGLVTVLEETPLDPRPPRARQP